ncbi:MAG TPA: thioesterase family protein [Flavisolibacter sp.]|jgi:YbgC/YbaW family acyl-CoA thioester hydrolase|nr:thioesterase family protein [Flavisolibacter sp.]
MARIKIELPEQFTFSTRIPIRITDLNYGGHVGNDTVLSLIHEARIQYLKSLGYDELNIEGVSLIMGNVGIEFKAELFYGDTVTAFVTANDLSRVGFDLYYKLMREETIVVTAKTGMICYNYETKKVVSLPAEVKEKLSV